MKKDSQSDSKTFTLCSSLKYDNVGILSVFESAILINECQSAIIFNSNVTWFLWEQASDESWQCKNSRSSLFFLDNRKGKTVYLKDDNGKFWVKEVIVAFFFLDEVATVQMAWQQAILMLNLSKLHFARLKPSLFERIHQLDRDYPVWPRGLWSLILPIRWCAVGEGMAFAPLS